MPLSNSIKTSLLSGFIAATITGVVSYALNQQTIYSNEKMFKISLDNQQAILSAQLVSQRQLFLDESKESFRRVNAQFEHSKSLLENELIASRKLTLEIIEKNLSNEKEILKLKSLETKRAYQQKILNESSKYFTEQITDLEKMYRDMYMFAFKIAYKREVLLLIGDDAEIPQSISDIDGLEALSDKEFENRPDIFLTLSGQIKAAFSHDIYMRFVKLIGKIFTEKMNKKLIFEDYRNQVSPQAAEFVRKYAKSISSDKILVNRQITGNEYVNLLDLLEKEAFQISVPLQNDILEKLEKFIQTDGYATLQADMIEEIYKFKE